MDFVKYDNTKKAIINPSDFVPKMDKLPGIAIACYSKTLFLKIVDNYECEYVGSLDYTDGEKKIYKIKYRNKIYTLFMISVGGAAAATCIEDLHELGCNTFIVFGNCGVIDSSINDLSIIIPNKAIRDEGVSFHYQEDNNLITEMNKKYTDIFKTILDEKGISYVEGMTWTTDAFYRETKKRVEMVKKMGAVCVEMEAASIQAVCNFRGIELFNFFYAADNLDNEVWDKRSLFGTTKIDDKMAVVELALELASKIKEA